MSDAAEPLDLDAIRERWADWFGPMSVKRNPVWPGREDGEEPGEYMGRLDVPALLAEVERLRAALTTVSEERDRWQRRHDQTEEWWRTARRDALTDAADAYQQSVEHPYASRVQAWLRARAAREEGR